MNNNIEGKRILFLCFNFYNYNVEIKKKLEELGARVDMFYQAKYTFWFTILIRLGLKNTYYKCLAKKIIQACTKNKYDYILVIEMKQEVAFYQKIKELQPKSRMILYYWDGLPLFDYRPYLYLFDKAFTFDIFDASNNEELSYLPLFFIDEYVNARVDKSAECKYDMLQVATYKEERYQQMNNFLKENKINPSSVYVYYKATLGQYLTMLIKGHDMRWLGTKELTQKEIIGLYAQSKCILDFDKKQQTGLSMRTIESIGACKKIITANTYIKNERYYNPNNIFIMGCDDIKRLPYFLAGSFEYSDCIEEYSLSNWCLKLFAS